MEIKSNATNGELFDFAYREKSEELAMAMGQAWPVAAKIALAPLAMSVAWTVAHSKKPYQ